jgi:multicomponent Na+:H+ antiporter subunit E
MACHIKRHHKGEVKVRGVPLLHLITLAAGLTALWFLLSGYFIPLILFLGFISILGVIWLAHRMDVVDHESHPIHMAPKSVGYYVWLLWEIVKANIDVTLAVLRGSDALRPQVFKVKASQVSDVGRVTYANSITLTPGTVTIFADGDELTIHSLTPVAREGLEGGEMDRRVTALEGHVAPGTEGVG